MQQLVRLFEPGWIGKMEIKNRLVMAPMGTRSLELRGFMNQRTIDYYVERARGGVGLILTMGASAVPKAHNPHGLAIHDDAFIPGLSDLTRAVHSYGVKIVCQPTHPGVLSNWAWANYEKEKPEGLEPVGPSPVPCFTYRVTPRELTREEIHSLVDAFAEAAVRGKKAGFDGAEIHACHGYFLGAFLSSFRNRRTDEYGGSVENRARFICEVIARTRQRVGPDFPVLIRMNGSDFLEGGLTVAEAQKQAAMFVEAGVDALNVSAATQDSRQWRDLTYMHPDGAIVHLAEAIKKVVDAPVITVGKIGDPFLAERILQEGKADFVAMGRALLADPELPNKARSGRFEDIRRCIYCNNCRVGFRSRERTQTRGAGLSCTVNPELLREREFVLRPTPLPKKIMVIGGGLAGMEAATILSQRGHQVSLYEKSGELGGQWNAACSVPNKSKFVSLTQYMLRRLYDAGVKVTLNKAVTRQFVEDEKPDAVVVATGASRSTLDIPGGQRENVVQAIDVFLGKAKVGDRVVVIGGALQGMEVASLLADKGKRVSIVTRSRLGGAGTPPERNIFVTLKDRLIDSRVMIFPFSPVFEIVDKGVYAVSDNELMFLPADTVVLATGVKPENKLVEELRGITPELHAIGDCVQPRDARDAIDEGAQVGRRI